VANKWSLLQRASQCGIPIPRTHFVDRGAAMKALAAQIEYPAVVKPVRSRILTDAGWLGTIVQYAHSASDLVRLYQDTEYLVCYPSLIQERIVGPGIGVFVLCDHGRLRAAFAHRRLREKPPSGGASVLCESIALDPELLDQAMRLLGPLAWHGVAMMEYKQDRRTGRSFLMEVNGRFWGSLQLAVDAGVDFPYLSYQLALGRPLEIPHTYKVGVRSRWLLGDLDHVLLRLFHRNGDQHLPDCAPSKVRTLLDFLKFAGSGLHYDVVSRDDPRPFLHEVHQYARDLSASAAHIVRRLIAPGSRPRLYSTKEPLKRSL
jgi:predicted ATP-grasp superfamily ATP-dependent carboligase